MNLTWDRLDEEEGRASLFLRRVGVGNSFEIKERSFIAPTLNFDFVKE